MHNHPNNQLRQKYHSTVAHFTQTVGATLRQENLFDESILRENGNRSHARIAPEFHVDFLRSSISMRLTEMSASPSLPLLKSVVEQHRKQWISLLDTAIGNYLTDLEGTENQRQKLKQLRGLQWYEVLKKRKRAKLHKDIKIRKIQLVSSLHLALNRYARVVVINSIQDVFELDEVEDETKEAEKKRQEWSHGETFNFEPGQKWDTGSTYIDPPQEPDDIT